MDMNSFGEDLVVKTRKPYTITKQREKWTEEEHSRFLEALKLHGRAWQRIEDHIGTKTAIQIRSHAQKFFTKLEKEAVATGTPLGQAHAIDIPPPRPKKKPNHPYPRKTMNPLPQELSAPEASVAPEPLRQPKECSDDDDARRSAILNLLPDAPPSASIGGGSKIHSGFREYVPAPPQPKEPCVESTSNGITDSPSALHTCSAMSYVSHPFPPFPPLPQLPSASASVSAALSREIASALLQNPGVYAAACVAAAASLWPSEEMYSPSMAALVAATVAAASAWWATNGPISFAISPPPTSPSPPANSAPAPQAKAEEGHETSSSSSNLEEIEKTLSDFKPLSAAAAAHHDSLDGEKMRKRDRSSCGSNATSGSEIETDAALIKKNGETNKDEAGEAHSENLPAGEATTRRARSSPFVNEAWKEVSQQGRLAFQALFARDSLPQSFATRLAEPEMELPEVVAPIGWGDQQIAQNCCSRPNEIIIKHGNLIKVRRTGFKPYKRCAAEAEVHKKSSANDETGNKKIRVQGQVST